ncbi:MAG: hypothetical protein HQM15_06440 [Deltaproteobacteria bacterium]|nr:hypothetical protein [Deltaproteobacteria bacterium]
MGFHINPNANPNSADGYVFTDNQHHQEFSIVQRDGHASLQGQVPPREALHSILQEVQHLRAEVRQGYAQLQGLPGGDHTAATERLRGRAQLAGELFLQAQVLRADIRSSNARHGDIPANTRQLYQQLNNDTAYRDRTLGPLFANDTYRPPQQRLGQLHASLPSTESAAWMDARFELSEARRHLERGEPARALEFLDQVRGNYQRMAALPGHDAGWLSSLQTEHNTLRASIQTANPRINMDAHPEIRPAVAELGARDLELSVGQHLGSARSFASSDPDRALRECALADESLSRLLHHTEARPETIQGLQAELGQVLGSLRPEGTNPPPPSNPRAPAVPTGGIAVATTTPVVPAPVPTPQPTATPAPTPTPAPVAIARTLIPETPGATRPPVVPPLPAAPGAWRSEAPITTTSQTITPPTEMATPTPALNTTPSDEATRASAEAEAALAALGRSNTATVATLVGAPGQPQAPGVAPEAPPQDSTSPSPTGSAIVRGGQAAAGVGLGNLGTPSAAASNNIGSGGTIGGGPGNAVLRAASGLPPSLSDNIGVTDPLSAGGRPVARLNQAAIGGIYNHLSDAINDRKISGLQSVRIGLYYEPGSSNRVRVVVLQARVSEIDPATGNTITRPARPGDRQVNSVLNALRENPALIPSLSSPTGETGSVSEFNVPA